MRELRQKNSYQKACSPSPTEEKLMLLVDSSVWIDWLRGADTDAVRFVQER